MEERSFKKLKKAERYLILKKEGVFLASRMHSSFQVGLYYFNGMYIELWKRIGLDYVDYIEVVDKKKAVDSYVDFLDLGLDGLLGEGK
ncbi:MAG: hypothetical protein ACJAYM_000507 [Flavobacteriales bacterium]|jgi:hypothetical protein